MIQNVQSKSNIKKIDHKKYEINLGSFKNKEDAKDFVDKVGELGVVISQNSDIYSVKLKDKFDFQHALTTSEIIRSEYHIIATITERENK
ncbi:SPOR domain-containing protein [Candidatus Cytomitobacter indipagum]|nr:SPOR domain-containing protein [Candidatus Cytomitobacter indipagum]